MIRALLGLTLVPFVSSANCSGTSLGLDPAECASWLQFFDGTGGAQWTSCANRNDPCSCGGTRCTTAEFLCVTCALGKITGIALSNNGLKGEIPDALFNLTSLSSLGLTQNSGMHGIIPASISKLQKLSVLELAQTHIAGPIPATIGELKKLTLAVLNQNYLNGTVPSSLAGLSKLRMLSLWGNQLEGALPKLPFSQFTIDCILDNPSSCKGQNCNKFTCPLPVGSHQCHGGDSGEGVHCK
jgi:hypothetical protein